MVHLYLRRFMAESSKLHSTATRRFVHSSHHQFVCAVDVGINVLRIGFDGEFPGKIDT